MATTKDYGIGEFDFPRGWFMIADSHDVGSDKPLAVRYFGRDFALYRGKESGKVVLLDAYCPHMGTHMALNSTSYVAQDGPIEGDSLRCPYHAWRFGADGKCNHIPYSSGPIPPAAKVRSWPVKESMGAVFVWHDPEGGEPEWDAPFLSEWDEPNWVRWDRIDDLGTINTHPQEIVDNITDAAHFGPVHGSRTRYFENEFKGHLAIQRMAGGHRTLAAEGGPLLVTEAIYNGPSILITRMSGLYDSYIFIAHTPVDDGSTHVWHSLLVKTAKGGAATDEDRAAAKMFSDMALAAFAQDFEVWKYKKPCLNGMFVQGDGAFLKQRAWYKQFYNPRAMKQEFLKQVEGIHVPRGMQAFPKDHAELAAA
jgi:3-ketosteroid 9alpha-monooxygenase subunit A